MSNNQSPNTQKRSFPGLSQWKEIYRPESKVARFLSVLIIYGISYGLFQGIRDNYLAEIVGITPFERGVVEFFRELPGLLVVLILALMYRFTQSRIFKIGIAIMAAGLVGLTLVGTGKIIVVVFMVLFSFGEHIIMPVRTTINLDYAKMEKAGASLGVTTMINSVGHIIGFLGVMGIFFLVGRLNLELPKEGPFKIVLVAASVLMILAVFIVMALKETRAKGARRRFYFAKKFKKYYMLEIFYGARKQIFMTFAPYVLIKLYGADASVISLLYLATAGVGIVLSPFVGKLIDYLGYKFIMVADTLLLVVVCLAYGFAHRIFPMHVAFYVVCVNYVLDSIISMGSMATNVYVQRISTGPDEVTATLSTGVSVNHVISILIALLGGWIWEVTGIELLFSLSAFLGVINSIYAATIKKDEENQYQHAE